MIDLKKARSAVAVLSCALFLGVASIGPAQASSNTVSNTEALFSTVPM